ncbi:MAG: Calx-beta domain-containing protein [Actinomycetota bacterium]
MRGRIVALLVVPLFLALPPAAEASSSRACADIYPSMALGPFQPEAETTPFFWGAEGSGGSFSVHFTGIDCGFRLETTAWYSDVPGSADASDYNLPDDRTQPVCGTPASGCPNQRTVSFQVAADGETEPVVESFTISLSDPRVNGNSNPSALTPPPSVPFLIVDDDPPTRVAFDDLSYSRSETYATLTVPVWRGGPANMSTTVPYTVGPGPGAAATANEDFGVTSPNPLVFNVGERVKPITLSIANDEIAEPEETVELSLQSPTGGEVATPSTKVVTILDNEENIPPSSRFHHPRNKWRYKKGDYRIREFHVFAHDEAGGSGVVAAEIALRRNLMNGKCAWKTKKGWQRKDCQNRTWLPTKYSEAGDLFYYRMKQLKSSVKTKIKNYTAFSRAVDGAGNVEKEFIEKRNDNTFEIKRSKRRR